MNLSRSEALFLSKILFHYEKMTYHDKEDEHIFEQLLEISDRIEEFLTGVAPAPLEIKGEGSSCTHDESLDDEDEEGDDDEDETPSANVPIPSAPTDSVSAGKLHDLDPLESQSGSVEFEENDEETVDILVNMSPVIDGVSILKRTGKTLEAWSEENGTYLTLDFPKIPKPWKSILKDGVVYDVAK
jgi:hypothetical protein